MSEYDSSTEDILKSAQATTSTSNKISTKRSKKRKRRRISVQEEDISEEEPQNRRDDDYEPKDEPGSPLTDTPRRSGRVVVKPEFPDSASTPLHRVAAAEVIVEGSVEDRFKKMAPQIPRVLGVDINLFSLLTVARGRLLKQHKKRVNLCVLDSIIPIFLASISE